MNNRPREQAIALRVDPRTHRDLFFELDQNKVQIMVLRQIKFDENDIVKSVSVIRLEPSEQETIYKLLKPQFEKGL